ncbi:MAG: DUF4167 domain-containing protein [Pseudomonadota bacterium]|nr:DUF4167 domain-containing protein [Pseudomonadota bacterium]
MINNRQNGRRRGRGGGGPRTPNNNAPGPGNRQENRSRGNASQLHEKYKALARDTQLAGDRVQTEYYLQFADHYFRVLNESRPRFEEQRRPQGDFSNDDEDDQDEAQNAADDGDYNDQDGNEDAQERPERQDRNDRPDRNDRADRPERNERPERAPREERQPRFEQPRSETRSAEPRSRPPRPRREPAEDDGDRGDQRIALESLPPAISIASSDDGDAPASPRRRTRRPRSGNDDADIAPAA